MRSAILSVVALAGIAGSATAQVQLDLRATIDLSAVCNTTNGIGNNPSSVAWNGLDLWVAGYNNSGVTPGNVGIARVSNALSSPTIGAVFGNFAASNSRGYSNVSINGNNLAASIDNGSGSAQSLALYDAGAQTRTWQIGDPTAGNDSTRRCYGATFDPGWSGSSNRALGMGVGSLGLGSGRRGLFDPATGAPVSGQSFAGGVIINFNPASTTFRDSAYDPATGDLYVRESNRVGRAYRVGDNAFSNLPGGASSATPMVAIGGFATATGVDNQNLAYCNSVMGTFIIANNRTSAGTGQSLLSVVRAIDPASGAAIGLSFLNNGAAWSPLSGNGAYDFSFDAASNTLAVSDFANRSVYIFQIPTPGAAAMLGLGGLAAFRRRRA